MSLRELIEKGKQGRWEDGDTKQEDSSEERQEEERKKDERKGLQYHDKCEGKMKKQGEERNQVEDNEEDDEIHSSKKSVRKDRREIGWK